ncbi:MAG: Fe-S protein assembly co-chaperone HscB [Candidatus Dasytiphilus stammeri]
MNFFKIFNLPENLNIDEKLLAIQFHNLQRKFHPDRWVNSSEKEKKYFLEKSCLINKAWTTLRDPLLRAEHLLIMHGFNPKTTPMQDNYFLEEQLNLCEEYETITKLGNKEQLFHFSKKIKLLLNQSNIEMKNEIEKKKWNQAGKILQKIFFLNKIIYKINEL